MLVGVVKLLNMLLLDERSYGFQSKKKRRVCLPQLLKYQTQAVSKGETVPEWLPVVVDHICQAGGVRELLISSGQDWGGGVNIHFMVSWTRVRADPDRPCEEKSRPSCQTGGSATVTESQCGRRPGPPPP